jgi:hypothetical protein
VNVKSADGLTFSVCSPNLYKETLSASVSFFIPITYFFWVMGVKKQAYPLNLPARRAHQQTKKKAEKTSERTQTEKAKQTQRFVNALRADCTKSLILCRSRKAHTPKVNEIKWCRGVCRRRG